MRKILGVLVCLFLLSGIVFVGDAGAGESFSKGPFTITIEEKKCDNDPITVTLLKIKVTNSSDKTYTGAMIGVTLKRGDKVVAADRDPVILDPFAPGESIYHMFMLKTECNDANVPDFLVTNLRTQ